MTENEAKRPKIAVIGGGRNAGRTLKAHIELLEELEAYRAIGTVEEIQSKLEAYRELGTMEELKALKEKSVAKKAKWHPNPCAEDNRIPICPNCNTIMVRTEIFGRTIDEHCVSCGQAIDWSE